MKDKEYYDKKIKQLGKNRANKKAQKLLDKWLKLQYTARGYEGVNQKKADKIWDKAEKAKIACLSFSYSLDAIL